MQVGESTLQRLIEGEKQFQVPLYQRPYSWDTAQHKQLWKDVLDQYEAIAPDPESGRQDLESPPHFLGSMVLAPSPMMQAHGVTPFLLIDGQQRLTTLLLAMCALRDQAATTDPEAIARFNKRYLINEYGKGTDFYRLLPTRSDRAPFFACVKGAENRGGTDLVGKAYNFFRAQLALHDSNGAPLDIDRLEAVLRTRLIMVAVTTSASDNVHRIFESLNDRGLRLSQADLLRNFTFMLLPKRADRVYDEVWAPMQESLGPDNLETLVFVDLILRGQSTVRRQDIYRAQQARLHKLANDEAAVEREVVELARRGRLFKKIVDPSIEPHPGISAALRRLATWGSAAPYPLLLHLFELVERHDCTADEMAKALGYVESYLVRRMIANVAPNSLNRIFNTIVARLPKELPIAEAVRYALSAERRYWPSDEKMRSAILSEPFYFYGRHDQKMFVFRRLEESFRHEEPIDFDRAKLSIEHIMPQTLTEEWKASLAETGDEPETVHVELLHTLGNLTITAYNGVLSNAPFDRKRQILEGSHLELNRAITPEARWGGVEIRARAQDLADRVIALWPGPVEGATEPAEGRDWSRLHAALAALPAGCWTTYADLAELIGSHPVPVGQHVAASPILNAHRVLASSGKVAKGFRWSDATDSRSVHDVLRSEGVRFDADLVADPSQRVTAEAMAALLDDLDGGDAQQAIGHGGTKS